MQTAWDAYKNDLSRLERERNGITARLHRLDDMHEWTEAQTLAYESLSARWHEIGLEISNIKRQGA